MIIAELKRIPEGNSPLIKRMMDRVFQVTLSTERSESSYGVPVILREGAVIEYGDIAVLYFYPGSLDEAEKYEMALSPFVRCERKEEP